MNEIAGYTNEKKELQELCKILQNINKLSNLGLRMPKGIMLVGKPGVGKTVMAKALIRDSGLNCVKIDFDTVGNEKFVDYLQDKFNEAITNGPSIVFMDELDKICGKDNPFRPIFDMENSRKILKVINDNESDKIVLLATVNDKDMLHPALCRSGRFDRVLNIPLPSLEDRKEIIKHYSKGKQFDKKVNFDTIAKLTGSFSGSDIECIINESGLKALVDERDVITMDDVNKAININVFNAIERKNTNNNDNKKVIATHEAGHLIAGLILDKDNIGNASIIAQGDSNGHITMGNDNNATKTKKDLLNKIVIGLAGRASEKVFFPDEDYLSCGSDVIKSSSLAKRLVTFECSYGFEYSMKPSRDFEESCVSDEKLRMVETKCDEILNECYEKAKKIINDNYDITKVFIDKLLKRFTLTRDEVLKIYNKELKKRANKTAA